MIVVDTDVLIDALRGRSEARTRIDEFLRNGSLSTTVINAFELLSGARVEAHRSQVEAVLSAARLYPLDAAACRAAAAARRELEARGRGIGTADYLIAGICLTRGASLLTRNREHFARVDGLILESL